MAKAFASCPVSESATSSVSVWKEVATLLGLWHELRRGSPSGVHALWCAGRLPLLLVPFFCMLLSLLVLHGFAPASS